MMSVKIILQPIGNKSGLENYKKTIKEPIDIKKYEKLFDNNLKNNLYNTSPSGKSAIWGIAAGNNNINKNKWQKISLGDVVLFCSDKKIICSGIIQYKFHSSILAEEIWGKDSNNNTWEYIYFLDEIKNLEITYKEFNKFVGYKENNIIRAFSILKSKNSEKFLLHYGLLSNRHINDVSDKDFEIAVDCLDELDLKVTSFRRKEQSMLRKILLSNKDTYKCFICNRNMNSEYLVGAHVKPRSHCTNDEKKDLKGIAMLACRFGCDYLFELGFIGLNDELKLIISNKLQDQVALKYIEGFHNKKRFPLEQQIKYFEWHFANRFRK
jgi:hypothetical protein